MHFDFNTTLVTNAALLFVLLLSMGFLWLATRPRRPELAFWALAYGVLGAAALLVFLRGDPPNPFVLLLSNFFLCGFFPVLDLGIASFEGRKPDLRRPVAFMAVTMLVFVYFTVIDPRIVVRFVVYSLAVIFYSLVLALAFDRKSRPELRAISALASSFFALLALLHALRLVLGLRLGLPPNIVSSGTWEPVIQAVAAAIALAAGFDLILLHAARMNAQLAEASRLKDLLFREMAHRTKNDLALVSSLIGLERSMLEDEELGARLDALRDRLVAVERAHDRLSRSSDPGSIRLDEYLAAIVEGLPRRSSVRIELKLEAIEAPFSMAVPLGLILNELATNALKHAFPEGRPGRLDVELKEEAGRILLGVGDDGIGMAWPPASQGLGTLIVLSMAEKLGAALRQVSEGGSSFLIDCPREA
ncbi:MAG TPA: sensor histidine kinase [Rectinemataceae bacterium]|nr:sensor histidine kinase [Rectinemataceae bacterium]